ncbi:hydroxymethylbilane synthase [Prosthecochloris sp. ZM]|uniref:Porphobilinogen deaminase n=1 Tax=Prosthecochloris aestuarii (strain DSM 271 / SK 413) TaxID=290512 RepID=HEM3_PROA2|nr:MULTISPECIES: hydroxymethylbilane synthase [Prosthecochloris]B4S922.1 RecName: Full=Porphobilinogen deaminase; Short=PBG; AltName: Full=Hydroxymethylbilane synthase; Short=HMBS; AltName: Full=Pre-uroporphyrinogen synthase [Prosthecochloris aestuarii DSM 271]ACF46559.1 porphobilinogen deaminase [Prosthecochloris aestuarii DSM 271]NEX12670.1 hydroxymethylbilane synthase [Prosthecochloris sp.]RDD29933.1 hydroxymethylbilane synthase [Prosthecochloris sp. ZM]
MKQQLIIGTRSSPLALWQAEFTKAELSKNFPELDIQLKLIKTTGDVLLDSPLSKIGDMGLFTKDIEKHLLAKEIDLAVHSLKDVPTETPEGLILSAFTEREDTRDVIISKNGDNLKQLKPNAKIATSSLRRTSQLLGIRPDFEMGDIRGNLNTRFKRFDESDFDAMILAYAGVHRLNFGDRISEILPHDVLLPAVGQGALGIETRIDDEQTRQIVKVMNNQNSEYCTKAERALLRHLQGGCQIPIGAYATYKNGTLHLSAFVGSVDGKRAIRNEITKENVTAPELAEKTGIELAEELMKQGANEILAEIRKI